jgi:hypothetical protein
VLGKQASEQKLGFRLVRSLKERQQNAVYLISCRPTHDAYYNPG